MIVEVEATEEWEVLWDHQRGQVLIVRPSGSRIWIESVPAWLPAAVKDAARKVAEAQRRFWG